VPDKACIYLVGISGIDLKTFTNVYPSNMTYEEKVDTTSTFTFDLSFSHNSTLKPENIKIGMPVSFYIGYDRGDINQVFSGEVYNIKLDFSVDRGTTLKVTCHDYSYMMKKNVSWKVYVKASPDAIIKTMMTRYPKIKYILDSDELKNKFGFEDDQSFNQEEQTDWEVLFAISRLAGYRPFFRNGTLYIVDRDYILSNLQTHQFIMVYDLTSPIPDKIINKIPIPLISFNPVVSGDGQASEVNLISWKAHGQPNRNIKESMVDGKPGKDIYTDIKVISDNRLEIIRIPGKYAMNDGQAKMMVKAELKRRAEKLVTGSGRIHGNQFIRLGDRHEVLIRNAGDFGVQYSGDYFISRVKHTVNTQKGFETEFDVERADLTKYN